MRIVGTGVDLVEVPRFGRAVARWGDRLLRRVFTEGELAYARRHRVTQIEHLAARFAAKEAVVKALGAPKGLGLEWKDLEVRSGPGGEPSVRFSRTMSRWGGTQVHLSLTHTPHYAVATALVCEP